MKKDDFDRLDRMTTGHMEAVTDVRKKKHLKKIMSLKATRTPEKPLDDTNFIVNQSKFPLDAAQWAEIEKSWAKIKISIFSFRSGNSRSSF